MELIWFVMLATVAVLVFFDYTNGFHDAADMVATAIASRAMSPGVAIALLTFGRADQRERMLGN